MKKLLSFILVALFLSVASFAITPITGATSTCMGSSLLAADSLSPGGTWSSSNTAIATVAPYTVFEAFVTGVGAGTATITYTLGGSFVTETVTINPLPAAITGTTTLCTGASATLADATPGGIWSSTSPSIASIGSGTGLLTGITAGSSTIYYTSLAGCSITTTVTVTSSPVVTVKGASSVCVGSVITLSDSAGYTGGTWASANPAIATVSGSGLVTGISGGSVGIIYTLTTTCGSYTRTVFISVISSTPPSAITGSSTVMALATTTLTDTTIGGTWSSNDTTVARINATTGVVTGIAAGTAVITYTISGCSGPIDTTTIITVTPFDGISGHVLFTGTAYYGPVKVYLITFDTATLNLAAYDSTTIYSTGTSAYYQFTGVPTDSFRIKAALPDSPVVTTGYMPTYHASSFYWYAATVLPHVSGIADINQDVTMSYGTITGGPGFIGGNVTTGANKGTSTGAAGLRIYLMNDAGTIVQTTLTDASGKYTFSELPVGTSYSVFPEALNYVTTKYPYMMLTTASPSVTTASFIQHTISYKITPIIVAGVNNIDAPAATANIFPNPSNGRFSIQWNMPTTEKGTVRISDITGRELYTTTIDMTAGNGTKQMELSDLTNGVYMISIRSASINNNSKLQITN